MTIWQRGQPEEQEDLQYASIHFSNKQTDPDLYYNIRPARPHRHMEQQEDTEYTAVKFNRASTTMSGTGSEWLESDVLSSKDLCRKRINSEHQLHLHIPIKSSAPQLQAFSTAEQFFISVMLMSLRCSKASLCVRPELVFRFIQASDSGEYYCTAENELGRKTSTKISVSVEYPPMVPTVSVSPTGENRENSSVNLTCSSDANPAAKYTWYKENQTLPKERGHTYHFTSISSEDRGTYYCKSENVHGWKRSLSLLIDVQYSPKLPSVSVSPSAEIVEGSSVNLTCSSDANPAANYTWYKEHDHRLLQSNNQLVFRSIQASDSGEYYCTAENELGRKTSTKISVNVEYSPKLPSVSVSPSAEIVEGSSVNLTCSSDANPAARYTWYKEHDDSPTASGQIFTITEFTAEHGGNYYCEARNTKGHHNSTLHLIVAAGGGKLPVVAGTITVVFVVIVSFSVFLWIRKRRASYELSEAEERSGIREQEFMCQTG
uniref:B-cell receptor CD22-like n=1 Tax=Semicossyphus pulcher TaxID=241346 RepID=UPI0037E8D22D